MATTKLELTQINARLAAENEALRKQVADLRMSNDLLLVQISHMDIKPSTVRPARHMPAWQAERAQAMAAAKAAAMAMRCVVKA